MIGRAAGMAGAMTVASVATAVAAAMAPLPTTAPPLTDLRAVVLHPGVNRVAGFLAAGGTATIVEAWRGNGNAHGHTAWMVLAGPSEGNPVGLVGWEGDGEQPASDTIGDSPFDGERVLSAVRFATARLAGRQVSLLIAADLDASASGVLADRATATVRWFRLDHDADAIGRPTDAFVPIARVRTARRYCNAELALRDVAGLPLPKGFAAANRVDGCVADG